MTAMRMTCVSALLSVLLAGGGRTEEKKRDISEKEFRRATVLLLEDPLGKNGKDIARLCLLFTMQTPDAAIVLGKEEMEWVGKDKERGLLLLAAYAAGNAASQLDSGVKRNDRYAGLLYLFRVYRTLRQKDRKFKIPAVDELRKLHKEDKLVKHLLELEKKKPTKLSPEDEKAIRKILEKKK